MVGCVLQGALGRFINHSCEPNCETQKWVVQGELAIGLFTQRSVKAGEELTFDYNFERYGDKVSLLRTGCINTVQVGLMSLHHLLSWQQSITANYNFIGEPD